MSRTQSAMFVAFTELPFFSITVAAQVRLASVTKKGDLLETLLLQEINKHRAAAGMPPLKVDDRIRDCQHNCCSQRPSVNAAVDT